LTLPTAVGSAFIEVQNPLSIIGRMPELVPVPFNARTARANSGTSAAWTGAGAKIPVSQMSLETVSLDFAHLSGIVPFTKELAMLATPEATGVFRNDLAKAVARFSDVAFLDPTAAAVANVSPASVTYGAPNIPATGTTAAAARDDVKSLLSLLTTNYTAPYLAMTAQTAIQLSTVGDSSGLFENVGAKGGNIAGNPVLTSGNVPADSDSPSDGIIVLLDAAEIFLADGGIGFDSSDQSLLEMTTSPDSPSTSQTVLVSLWQMDMFAIKVSRFINWKLRRSGAVAYLTGVNYSG
jgi:HK97 family phage major capsid protein